VGQSADDRSYTTRTFELYILISVEDLSAASDASWSIELFNACDRLSAVSFYLSSSSLNLKLSGSE